MRPTAQFTQMAIVIMLTGSFSAPVLAQTWSKSYTLGSGTHVATSISQTTDGGYILSGYVDGANSWITKLDGAGNVEWSYSITGAPVRPQALETLDGGFALGGAIAIRGADNCYDVRFGLAKFNPTGALQWHKQYGPDTYWNGSSCVGGAASPRSMIEAPDGSFLMSGEIPDGSPYGLWLVKVDSGGDVIWQKRYSTPGWDRQATGGNQIGILPGGGIVLVGHGTDYSGAGQDDVWVLRLDSNGEIVWQRAYGGSHGDVPHNLSITDEGNVVITSWTLGSWGAYSDPWVLELDENGTIVSQRLVDFWNAAGGSMSATLPNGNLIVASAVNGGTIAGFAEVSLDGNLLWSKRGLPQAGASYCVSTTGDGGLIFATTGENFAWHIITVARTDALGGVDNTCPPDDHITTLTDISAIITPTVATAHTTSEPTVDMPPLFDVLSWTTTENCINLAPQVFVNPNPVDFGNIPIWSPSSEIVTISNTGTANLFITSMSVGSPFSLTSSCAGFNLPPGISCDATVEITPDALGAISATLSIGSDDPATPMLDVPVMAFAVDPSHIFADGFESGDTSAWFAGSQ